MWDCNSHFVLIKTSWNDNAVIVYSTIKRQCANAQAMVYIKADLPVEWQGVKSKDLQCGLVNTKLLGKMACDAVHELGHALRR